MRKRLQHNSALTKLFETTVLTCAAVVRPSGSLIVAATVARAEVVLARVALTANSYTAIAQKTKQDVIQAVRVVRLHILLQRVTEGGKGAYWKHDLVNVSSPAYSRHLLAGTCKTMLHSHRQPAPPPLAQHRPPDPHCQEDAARASCTAPCLNTWRAPRGKLSHHTTSAVVSAARDHMFLWHRHAIASTLCYCAPEVSVSGAASARGVKQQCYNV